MSNYATKSDLKKVTDVDALDFAKIDDLTSSKSNIDKLDIDKLKNVLNGLSSLKSKVDKLDVDKLLPVPIDLKKLSDVVDKEVVKKDMYDELVKKVDAIKTTDTRKLVKKLAARPKLMK